MKRRLAIVLALVMMLSTAIPISATAGKKRTASSLLESLREQMRSRPDLSLTILEQMTCGDAVLDQNVVTKFSIGHEPTCLITDQAQAVDGVWQRMSMVHWLTSGTEAKYRALDADGTLILWDSPQKSLQDAINAISINMASWLLGVPPRLRDAAFGKSVELAGIECDVVRTTLPKAQLIAFLLNPGNISSVIDAMTARGTVALADGAPNTVVSYFFEQDTGMAAAVSIEFPIRFTQKNGTVTDFSFAMAVHINGVGDRADLAVPEGLSKAIGDRIAAYQSELQPIEREMIAELLHERIAFVPEFVMPCLYLSADKVRYDITFPAFPDLKYAQWEDIRKGRAAEDALEAIGEYIKGGACPTRDLTNQWYTVLAARQADGTWAFSIEEKSTLAQLCGDFNGQVARLLERESLPSDSSEPLERKEYRVRRTV